MTKPTVSDTQSTEANQLVVEIRLESHQNHSTTLQFTTLGERKERTVKRGDVGKEKAAEAEERGIGHKRLG